MTAVTNLSQEEYDALVRDAMSWRTRDRLDDAQPADRAAQLEKDCLTLAMRLYGESVYTFSPETAEVMLRWRPVVRRVLDGSKSGIFRADEKDRQ